MADLSIDLQFYTGVCNPKKTPQIVWPSAGFCLAVMTGVLKIDIKEVPFSSGIELGLS